MSVQQFCLRWNNHQPNFISVFSSLLHNEALVDVTLAAEGRQLQAHKVVLSACSSYFQSLFTTNPCQHPIVILKDVQYNDLKTMVDFMYYGEVNVSQEQLPHILKTAEMLKIKGLAEMPDPVSLTKSESKSSDQTDPNVQNSGVESMWGSSESQQYHQQTLQHQTSHQSQQQQSQRRSPTPGTISPSANRRKRLRKASTAGSGSASTERTSEEHSSIEGQADATNQPHDATHENVDAGNHSHHIHQISYIKKSDELSNVSQQQMPIDITSPTTPSDHGTSVSCSQSQTPHGVQWIDSNYRFTLSTCTTNVGLASSAHHNNPEDNQHTSNTAPTSNTAVSSNHTQIQYGSAYTSGQMITTLNPNTLVNNYSASLSTPTSPQGNDSNIVQYSQGPTPNQSPINSSGTTNQQQQSQQPPQAAQPQTTSSSSTSTATTSQAAPKRKRSVNPQSDENFQRALEAVRYGGIGFCKAARMYGCNNRTLWLEYKKRGYPISRPSIKNRIKLEPNMTPPPTSPAPTNEENTSMENYEHNMTPAQQSTINMSAVPPPAETPTSIMCPPHAHPAMGVMSFLDTTRTTHVSFEPHPTTLQRQRYPDGVNVNPTAINLQGLNFNSM
ncbi:broad-complex core protein isoform X4 [Sitodiplosis mosellana]|uniref:broad-complex core protein isoform X4 n=1 Tax=Sitodiplosis mosellana TaxID=263140 RepID=UPI002444165D|nr:broad-complex core protein isoform X4 [Sitodiplosis mosellana]